MVKHRLLGFAGYTVISYFAGGFVIALATPLVLSIASPQNAGLVMAGIGSGMLIGSIGTASRVGNAGGMSRLLRYDGLAAAAMLMVTICSSPFGVGFCGFVFSFALAGQLVEEQALWQVRIPAEAQGRVFALRKVLTWAALPASYAASGLLADQVFEPLVRHNAVFERTMGWLVGTEPGRGMALLIGCAGMLKVSLIAGTLAGRRWRLLDEC